jgi:hypothetical protein
MNDDRYLRSIKELEQVGSKWWPKEVREEAMNGLSPVSKWLLRTVFDNLRDAENNCHALVAIGDSMEVIDKVEYEQLRRDLISLGYSKDEVSRDFSELYSGDVTLSADYRID